MTGPIAPKLQLTREQINFIRRNLGLSTIEEFEVTGSHIPDKKLVTRRNVQEEPKKEPEHRP